jgi:MFS family permease
MVSLKEPRVAPSGFEAKPPERRGSGLVLAIFAIAQLMIILDVTVVNVALPTIQRELKFSPVNLENGYSVAFGGLLLLGGRMGDVFGLSGRFRHDSPSLYKGSRTRNAN